MTWSEVSRRRDSNPEPTDYKGGAVRLTCVIDRAGVEIARGDMMDPASLPPAMDGADAVMTTAAGPLPATMVTLPPPPRSRVRKFFGGAQAARW
jgi:uncharacterized protein YbjT (DUF2867 family)